MSLLPKDYTLDGSSLITISCGPPDDYGQYYQLLGCSVYCVEDFDFIDYGGRSLIERERMILAVTERALCDIARRSGASDVALREAAAEVTKRGFQLSVEIRKLRIAIGRSGNSVRVFRSLGAEFGESWIARIVRRDGSTIAEECMVDPSTLDRRDYFMSAALSGNWYVVSDRLRKETFRLDVSVAA